MEYANFRQGDENSRYNCTFHFLTQAMASKWWKTPSKQLFEMKFCCSLTIYIDGCGTIYLFILFFDCVQSVPPALLLFFLYCVRSEQAALCISVWSFVYLITICCLLLPHSDVSEMNAGLSTHGPKTLLIFIPNRIRNFVYHTYSTSLTVSIYQRVWMIFGVVAETSMRMAWQNEKLQRKRPKNAKRKKKCLLFIERFAFMCTQLSVSVSVRVCLCAGERDTIVKCS